MVFSVEHKTFMIEWYFWNGIAIEGEWHYNSGAVLQEFQQKCPHFNFVVADFYTIVIETVCEYFVKQVISKKLLDDQHCVPMKS